MRLNEEDDDAEVDVKAEDVVVGIAVAVENPRVVVDGEAPGGCCCDCICCCCGA